LHDSRTPGVEAVCKAGNLLMRESLVLEPINAQIRM
jgi:hypothetical protein